MSTVFSKIISGEFPGIFTWSDPHAVAFSSIEPIAPGHQLVVPRAEVDRYTELPEESAAHLFVVAQRVGRALEAAYPGSRACILVAGFEVPHTHLHVVPVTDQSQLSFANARAADKEDLVTAATAVRDALADLGFSANVPDIASARLN